MSTGITGGDMNSRLPLFDKKQFPEGIAGERPNFRDPKALHSTPGPQKKRPESSLAEQLIKSQLIKSQMLPSDKLDGVFLLSMSNSIQPNPYQGTTLGEYFRTRFNFDPSELKGSNPMGSVNQWSTNLSKTLNIILTVKKAETEEYKNLMKNVLVVREQKLYLKTTDGQEFGNSLGSVPNGLESIWDKNDPDYNTLQEVRNNVYKQVLDVVRHSMRTAVHGVVKEVESLRGDFGEMMADQSGLNQAKKRLEVDIKEHLAKGENLDTLEKQLGEISDLQAQVSAKYAQSEEQLKYLASLIKSAEIFKTEVANFDRILVTLEAEVESFNTEAQVYTTKLTELTQEIDRLSANLSKQKDEFVENNRKFDLNILLMDLPPKENPSPPQTTPAQPHKCSVFDGNPGEMASKPIAQAANDALANARITRNSGWEDKWNTHYTRKTPEEIGRIVLLALSKAIGDFDERYTSLSETFEALDSKIKSVSKMEQEYRNLEIKRSVLEGQRAAVDSERANLTDKEENFKVELKTLVTNLTDLRTLMGNLNQALLKPNGGENGETMQHTLERRNQEINALNEKINSFKKQSDEFQKNHKDLDQLPSIADLVNQMVDRTNVVIQAYAGIEGLLRNAQKIQ